MAGMRTGDAFEVEAPETEARPASRRRRIAGVLLTAIAGLLSSYCAVVVAVSVDDILLPGNELGFDAIPFGVPGIGKLQIEIPVDISIPIPEQVPIIGSAGSGSNRPRSERPINILVMGTDHTLDFAPEAIPGRTDTIFVVSIDPRLKRATILNFPRDSWLPIPNGRGEWTVDRINAAYPRAVTAARDEGAGPRAVIETIERNFGIPIAHYVVVDWHGFTRIVDALGGVAIRVEEDLYDPASSVLAPFGGRLSQGWYRFDGEQALAYSRYRADSDLHRIERQHQVIFSLIAKAASGDVLDDPLGLWNAYRGAVTTDINSVQIPGLGLLARQIDQERIKAYSLGPAARDYVVPGGAQVLLLDPRETARIVRLALPSVFKGGLHVQIQNGARQPGWSTRTKDYIVARGAPAIFLEARDAPNPAFQQHTVVINYTGDPGLAQQLARALGVPDDRVVQAPLEMGEVSLPRPDADIVVVAGADLPIE